MGKSMARCVAPEQQNDTHQMAQATCAHPVSWNFGAQEMACGASERIGLLAQVGDISLLETRIGDKLPTIKYFAHLCSMIPRSDFKDLKRKQSDIRGQRVDD
jgi:hypothetical protein